ncbi:hypothetical protein CI109_102350 [Kwoniella shandongensis]|uniref:CENP-V/GFA domain-containing protein n=1 Tax=Kwoniella shandongensis TaxID=1734106 RepID=A0AAJ8MVU2_9TREE
MPHQGQCLCGSSKIIIHSTKTKQDICHCTDCQHISGSAFGSSISVNESDVEITGDEIREFHSKAANGNPVTRVFCGKCGSSLAQKGAYFRGTIAIQTGNLPDFRMIPYGEEIFVKDRWEALSPVPGAKQVDGMPTRD